MFEEIVLSNEDRCKHFLRFLPLVEFCSRNGDTLAIRFC